MDEQKDKIKDLEVKEGEAQDVAGGKEANPLKWGSKSGAKKAPGYRMRASSSEKKQT